MPNASENGKSFALVFFFSGGGGCEDDFWKYNAFFHAERTRSSLDNIYVQDWTAWQGQSLNINTHLLVSIKYIINGCQFPGSSSKSNVCLHTRTV